MSICVQKKSQMNKKKCRNVFGVRKEGKKCNSSFLKKEKEGSEIRRSGIRGIGGVVDRGGRDGRCDTLDALKVNAECADVKAESNALDALNWMR
jgi:hypothetical protein